MGSPKNAWDEIMAMHKKDRDEGQLMLLELLFQEIDDYNYTSFNDLKGAMHMHLDRLKGVDNE